MTMTLPESETVDHPRKREETHNTIKLSSSQLNYKGKFNHTTIQLRTQHKTPHKSDENQAMDKIQYAVTSTSFNIFGKGIYIKYIRPTSYTLSKGPGQDKLAMSCTYSFSSLLEKLK